MRNLVKRIVDVVLVKGGEATVASFVAVLQVNLKQLFGDNQLRVCHFDVLLLMLTGTNVQSSHKAECYRQCYTGYQMVFHRPCNACLNNQSMGGKA